MPHTPARPDDRESDHREGEFADLFARRTRTPLRGFLPGRRVWNAVGGSAVAVLVIAGSATAVAAIDWSGGSSEKVTTAADEPTKEKSSSGDTGKATVVPSPKVRDSGTSGKQDPEVVYVPVSGGAGGDGARSAPDSDTNSGATGTTGTAEGTTGSTGTTGSQEKQSSTTATQNTGSQSTTDYLWADGNVDADSNDYWDQSSVTVKSTTPLTELKVVVRLAQTGGVAHTGFWSSLGDKVNMSQAADSNQLAYVVTLKPGVTLGAGTYVLQFQYNHDQGGRDAGGDRYNVTTTSSGSVDAFRAGAF
ncbi:hypothetical protein [Streptomyces sp. NPDC000878]